MRTLRLMLILTSTLLLSCGEDLPAVDAATKAACRPIFGRAMARALHDSTLLAAGEFDAHASMSLAFLLDGDSVRIEDRFLLKKGAGGLYRTEPQSHEVRGDTALLKDMYTFNTSQGDARKPEGAQLAGLNFGASYLELLRVLLADNGAISYAVRDSAAQKGGEECYHVTYATGANNGAFWITRDSCRLVRLEVAEESNYLIGSYHYTIGTDFAPYGGNLLLPVSTRSRFDFSRFFSDGTGSMIVLLDSVRVKVEG